MGAIELQQSLTELASRNPQLGQVSAVLVDRQAYQCAYVNCAPETAPCADTRASCVAKLFTATLLTNLLDRAGIGLGAAVAECLRVDERYSRGLAGINFTHLIDHTHGLDDSALTHCPLRADGTIDTDALCRDLLGDAALSQPGHLHSYGNAGAWLSAAVIEQLCGRPFRHVLEQELLTPLGISLREAPDDDITGVCPSGGGRWLLSAEELARMLAFHLEVAAGVTGNLRGHLDLLRSQSHALPGWNPTEQGICCGWKDYGADWYGHDGRWRGSSLLGRINISHRVAIVIGVTGFARRDPIYTLLEGLFGGRFPEVSGIRVPTLVSAEEARSADREMFKGVYQARIGSVTVFGEGEQLLLAIAGESLGTAAHRTYRLRAARDGLFITSPFGLELFPYVQFLRPAATGHYQYLWNGSNLWRRVSSTDVK
jgi:CubicO group peptidase (beta-lactamase class C family)